MQPPAGDAPVDPAWNAATWDWKVGDDGVFSSPSAQRNSAALLAALGELVFAHASRVLEIGSGTGEHVQSWATAWPQVRFQPTELSDDGRRSIATRTQSLPNVEAPFALPLQDAASPWPCDAVVACNLFHVAPVECIGLLARMAAQAGAKRVGVSGAFKRHGAHTAFSNANFDKMLRKTNAAWGVRDLDGEVAPEFARNGFALSSVREMPANNFVVVFARE